MKMAIIVLFAYWIIGFIIAIIDEDKAAYWAMGLVYPIALVLTYPFRAIRSYKNRRTYYMVHNISMIQYFFGKRVKE